MQQSQPESPKIFAVSRSRGKRAGESSLTKKMRERRIALGKGRESDESEPEEDLEAGAVVLHQLFNRKVVRYPDNTVVKSGPRIPLGEAEALKVAELAGIPAPRLRDMQADGFRMTCIEGTTLHDLWPAMPHEQRKDIVLQLRAILTKMRSLEPPPESMIGACDGKEIRDTRIHFTYHGPPCENEEAFNQFLLSSFHPRTPSAVREALARRLKTHHRIVLTHCDLSPRNIMVHDGKITGLIDWEDGGWYPEYWEFIKFFERGAPEVGWKEFASDIFAEMYPDELVDLTAFSKYQDV
ncbi:unnamed protein product [Clonostachys rosea]|uniref:Aminoglycoside phosphotransferase domain-containing protein n=1 Tax=Bionectria ochroleuca TaxID=29856 RepID=A0ABY6U6A1_BIOOC|nr:unnamed protein product [Clonostachys rosea]